MGAPAIKAPDAPPAAPAQETPAPAPAASPQPTPGDTPPPAQSGGPSDANAQPGASSRPSDIPTDVPYAKFRETQRELTRMRQQHEAFQREQQAAQAKWQDQIKTIEREAQDLRDYRDLLEANPDIAEMLIERVNTGKTARPRAATAPQAPAMSPELVAHMQRVDAFMRSQAEREQQARQAAQDQQVSQQLDKRLTQILQTQQYPETFLPMIRQFVIQQAALSKDPVEMEDVPYLAGLWVKQQEDFYNQRIAAMRAGKVADAALPATPGPTTAPVTDATKLDAFGPKTNEYLVQQLRERLGWGREQAG